MIVQAESRDVDIDHAFLSFPENTGEIDEKMAQILRILIVHSS